MIAVSICQSVAGKIEHHIEIGFHYLPCLFFHTNQQSLRKQMKVQRL